MNKEQILASISDPVARAGLSAFSSLEDFVASCGGRIVSHDLDKFCIVDAAGTRVVEVSVRGGRILCDAAAVARQKYKILTMGEKYAKIGGHTIFAEKFVVNKTSMWCIGARINGRATQAAHRPSPSHST